MTIGARIRRSPRASSFVRSSGMMILVISAASVCSAGITPMDLFDSGDELLTRDTVSGLDWLDLTQAQGLSFDDVVDGVDGWKDLGFSDAANSEIHDLFLQIEPTAPEPFDGLPKADPASRNLAKRVNALLGPTGMDGNMEFTLGFSGTPAGLDQVAAPFVDVFDVTDLESDVFINIVNTRPRATDSADPDFGHWLVRPVPEPAFDLLRGASLATLAALAVRRRRRSGRSSSRSEESAANIT